MRRLVSCVLFLSSLALATGCATYTQDLDRARSHYEANRFEQALALFRVLEHDTDSFSLPEQAQYAYLRGMTDYRLADLAPQGTGVSDPRKGYRDNARHWLGLAAAIEKQTPGGISSEQKNRLTETLADLNRDVYGGAETLPESDAAPDAASQPAAPAAPADAAEPPAPTL
ncbi:hypothetical protein WME89_07135 [Sorangium sp. So ce321]|uniref:hypothetical protein n=1 Tax=Sorangium sp. So ce321 TaxID=3133300 RepID=UPI003F607E41